MQLNESLSEAIAYDTLFAELAVAVEALNEHDTKLSMESVKETLAQWWAKLRAMVKRAWDRLTEFANAFFETSNNILRRLDGLEKSVNDARNLKATRTNVLLPVYWSNVHADEKTGTANGMLEILSEQEDLVKAIVVEYSKAVAGVGAKFANGLKLAEDDIDYHSVASSMGGILQNSPRMYYQRMDPRPIRNDQRYTKDRHTYRSTILAGGRVLLLNYPLSFSDPLSAALESGNTYTAFLRNVQEIGYRLDWFDPERERSTQPSYQVEVLSISQMKTAIGSIRGAVEDLNFYKKNVLTDLRNSQDAIDNALTKLVNGLGTEESGTSEAQKTVLRFDKAYSRWSSGVQGQLVRHTQAVANSMTQAIKVMLKTYQ